MSIASNDVSWLADDFPNKKNPSSVIGSNQIMGGMGTMANGNIGTPLGNPISDCSKSIIGAMHIWASICPNRLGEVDTFLVEFT